MNKFHYRIPEKSDTGLLIDEFIQQCDKVAEIARRWAEEHGASSYYESPDGMAGGIAAVEFPNDMPRNGWEMIKSIDGRVLFFPEAGTRIEKEMCSLPVVGEGRLVDILQMQPDNKGKRFIIGFGDKTPIVFRFENNWYIQIPRLSKNIDCCKISENEFRRQRILAMGKNIL